MARESTKTREQILLVAARSFMLKGYTETTLRGLAKELGGTVGIITNHFDSKEDILCALVAFVIEQQFGATARLMAGKTDDKILFYAAETVLQLHITEMSETLRDVYINAYTLPKASAILQRTVTAKLEDIFREHLPELETKDFYKLEIATGGIMRGFMTIPCDMWFTMDQKVEAFLRNTFLIYKVPKEKIQEAIEFVKQFDFEAIAQATIDGIFRFFGGEAMEEAVN